MPNPATCCLPRPRRRDKDANPRRSGPPGIFLARLIATLQTPLRTPQRAQVIAVSAAAAQVFGHHHLQVYALKHGEKTAQVQAVLLAAVNYHGRETLALYSAVTWLSPR